MKKISLLAAIILMLASCAPKQELRHQDKVQQKMLERIGQMPDLPSPYKMLDWKAKARGFDKLVFDSTQTGDYWPLIWTDNSQKNFPQKTFGIYTAIGDVRQGPDHHNGIFHESLTTMGAVLGATLMGIDKSNQDGKDYVNMLRNYFNKDTGWDIMMNNTCPEVALLGGGYGRDWWYDVFPNVIYYGIMNFYPNEENATPLLRSIADKFLAADSVLNGNYHHSFFNYGKLEPEDSQICPQQDAAAGHAYVLYAAYKKFGDKRYLEGAKSALDALLSQKDNTFYEILMPFGAYVAARLNAEEGTHYDFTKIMKWTFNGDAKCRRGWGVLADNWNGFDVSGLVGSTYDNGGYAFLMNTFDVAWALVPMVRYDPSWSKVVGKWMLNAANAAHLFYPYEIPDDHQTIPQLKSVTKGVIAYEGLTKKSAYEQFADIKAPVAQGDGPNWVKGKNPWVSQFSVYGSAQAGVFGSIIDTTNVKGVLQLNLLACDFYRDKAYPTYLYSNPYPEAKAVKLNCGTAPVDLYNVLTHSFIRKNVTGKTEFTLEPNDVAMLVLVPANGTPQYHGNKLLVNNVVVDYAIAK
ncbi:hypothetical protein [Prolixibacter denitrificans]|uniref:Uncharacterized protein n=1 Tax=Prolixibacter denitrificans TaxID=1541063 RepID=A0A2P8C9K9_9BACT|nr:hypothetical protein [Prolixibacter denitrificans]PSK81659.1 hypothetical protein CLV93_10857 [Prolixibacter denitrificans]GET21183.1 hypothetical protein JCM18694_14290 [Prolixibacter denitrificans]